MYVSMRWLARHVDLEGITPESLCNDLTLSTAEVEGLEPFAPALRDVVVGHVLEHGRHPDAEKLSLCKVDVGEGEPLSIVCGAQNVGAGQKVAVATVGTVLPGDFKIKKSKIRGVESFGMICSQKELGLGDDHEGIWVLPEGARIGDTVAAALDLEDFVIEIDNKSLTHRPDLWGHRGIAREIAAIYRRELRPLDTSLPELGSGERFPVTISSAACTRYIALPIDDVEATRSPDWLQHLLLAVGQRPIDLLVDLSNFVMLDIGQPNHVFDRGRLAAGIDVRNARPGEKMQTLDGEDRELTASDLLICSGDAPVALAGIMGGEESKVAEGTKSLILEIAHFDPVVVRRTSSRLGLRTDSSARFEKSLDPGLPLAAAAHFARLLMQISPGVKFPAPVTDVGDWTDPTCELRLRLDRVRTALGKDVDDAEIRDILERLDFGVEADGSDFRVRVPSYRATKDVTIEQDLVEEIGRIHRYGNIPEKLMRFEIAPPAPDPRRMLVRRLQDRLAGAARFHEVMSYSFVEDALLRKLGLLADHAEDAEGRPQLTAEAYANVINPVAQGMDKIRRSVLPSLLANLEQNRRHRDDVRLFEIGKGYRPEAANERGEPAEVHVLGLVSAGPPLGKKAAWDDGRMIRLQALVDDLVSALNLEPLAWSTDGFRPPWAHPSRCLFGRFGDEAVPATVLTQLEPAVAIALGLDGELKSDVAVAELSLDHLLAAKSRGPRYEALPRYPGIKVDVAVALAESEPARTVIDLIEKAGKGQVADVELFDVFRGEKLGRGRKSLAFHVLLQSDSKTLTDKDEQKFLERFDRLVQEAGGELRKG